VLDENKNQKTSFQVLPLDINIAKMQFNMLKRYEDELPENNNFPPIIEVYKNEDTRVDFSEINITCKGKETDKTRKEITITISHKKNDIQAFKKIFEGNKKEIMEYLNDKNKPFFTTVKSTVLDFSEKINS